MKLTGLKKSVSELSTTKLSLLIYGASAQLQRDSTLFTRLKDACLCICVEKKTMTKLGRDARGMKAGGNYSNDSKFCRQIPELLLAQVLFKLKAISLILSASDEESIPRTEVDE